MVALSREFWTGKRVLLTGHTGFKGAWAAIWLRRLGADVTGLALPPDKTSLYSLAGVTGLVTEALVDIRDTGAVRSALEGTTFDIVLHLAAQAIVRAAIEDPVATFDTNVVGTANLLQELRAQSDLMAVLVITSDKVYANPDLGRAMSEGDPLGGKDPYSASKAATELVVRSFAASFFEPAGIPLATARGGNVVGGGDYSRDRLVPDAVRAALTKETLILRHPEATRPWQHVLDCLAGYIRHVEALAMNPQQIPRALNFGPAPGRPTLTVGELASLITARLEAKPWCLTPDPASLEAKLLEVDTTLARKTLGFTSLLEAHAAADLTAEWYARQAAGEDALDLCNEQIEYYESLT